MKKFKFRTDITVVTVVIFIVCIVLVSVMLMQFRTIEQTDITEIENMRESELREALVEWTAKYDEINTQLDEVNNALKSILHQRRLLFLLYIACYHKKIGQLAGFKVQVCENLH